MKAVRSPRGPAGDGELAALIETLGATERRIAEITGGEVDSVVDTDGRTILLRHAQEQRRNSEAARQIAVLDALPANLALLDANGLIVSVNEAWQDFGDSNHLSAQDHCVGVNYLAICDAARGKDSAFAAEAAAGIRAVLAGEAPSFSIEYPCDSPVLPRWFLLKASPLAVGHGNGAVVMHVDVSKQKRAEDHLVRASRQAGMAEVATNILHNVGNVLNSINISATLAMDAVRASRAADLATVVRLMRDHAARLGDYLTADAKGRHIPAMLDQLAREWVEQQRSLMTELGVLVTNVAHVKRIVAMQQGYARVSGAAELVDLRDLVEDGLRMNADRLIEARVQIVRRFDDISPVSVEKHKVLQILVNLVRNALDACASVAGPGCRITIGIAEAGGRVVISVADTGSGIAAENLVRMFAHGFTTRKDGHGFGLHSGALAAAELGGALAAFSDGPGKGATFTLDLPATRTEAAHA